MFLQQPIIICTVLLFTGLFLFNKYLIKGQKNYMYSAGVSVVISLIIFLTCYTDRLIDTFAVIMIFILSGLIMLIPCYMVHKEMKYYRLVFIITHTVAFTLLAGIRTVILIPNPYYYVTFFMVFTSLYVFRGTEDKIKAFTMVGILLLLRFVITFDYYPPLDFEHRMVFKSFVSDTDELNRTQSKPVIMAIDYFETNHSKGSIDAVRSIQRDDDIIILITYQDGSKIHRLIYEDNHIREYQEE
ncbi:MAG: hypothetical protein JEZ08_22920 [Clostridiales bacterium]|nr:hypothetical protein [Clostridiales bacterium]